MDFFLDALERGGPVGIAMLVGAACFVLWRKLQTLRVYYEGDPDPDKSEKNPGKLALTATAGQLREDGIRNDYDGRLSKQRVHYEGLLKTQRDDYEAQLKAERSENKGLFREINETIRGLGDGEGD